MSTRGGTHTLWFNPEVVGEQRSGALRALELTFSHAHPQPDWESANDTVDENPSISFPTHPHSWSCLSLLCSMQQLRPPQKEDPHKDHPLYWQNTEGGLLEPEYFWRDHQQWLADAGYMLRPRFREDWQPSWLKSRKLWFQCEDGDTTAVSVLVSCGSLMLIICPPV